MTEPEDQQQQQDTDDDEREYRGDRLDGEDRPERHRVYDDEEAGPRRDRDIEFRETGDRELRRDRDNTEDDD